STWTVPAGVTSITIAAAGAQGGSAYEGGGSGAELTATFTVTPLETLDVLVGGLGQNGVIYSVGAGGGGGSFVYTSPDQAGLLIAAGGGGGSGLNNPGFVADPTSSAGETGEYGGGAGGTDGSGG